MNNKMNNKKTVYKILNIEDYGKLISYCINKDISVFRSYFEINRCYNIDYVEKKLYYADEKFYLNEGYIIKRPIFKLTKYGDYEIYN